MTKKTIFDKSTIGKRVSAEIPPEPSANGKDPDVVIAMDEKRKLQKEGKFTGHKKRDDLSIARKKNRLLTLEEIHDLLEGKVRQPNETYYIKRVIGVPGDRVSYRNKQLLVNGEPVPQGWMAEFPSGRYTVKMGREALPGTDGHLMQVDNRRGPRNFSVVVQPGHYFMMGDNRDNSSDSRYYSNSLR